VVLAAWLACVMSTRICLQESPAATEAEVEGVLQELLELRGVLVEGGLSGEMRARGAEAVARASALLVTVLEQSDAVRGRAEAAESRIAAPAPRAASSAGGRSVTFASPT
jgi:hypothetical protein